MSESHAVHRWSKSLEIGEKSQTAFMAKHPVLVYTGGRNGDFTIGVGGDKLELKAEQYYMDKFKNRGKGKLTRNIAVEIMSRKRKGSTPYVSGVGQAVRNKCRYIVSWFHKDDVEFWFDPQKLWDYAVKCCREKKHLRQWVVNEKPTPDAFCVFIPYDELIDEGITIPSPLKEVA